MIISKYSIKEKVFEKNTQSLSLSLNIATAFCAENFYKNFISNLNGKLGLSFEDFLRIHCEVLCWYSAVVAFDKGQC